MLTLEDLKNMEPKTIFAAGVAVDAPGGVNMTNSGDMLRWIAIRGGIHNWTIYCGYCTHSERYLANFGDKIYNKKEIRRLVECDDEAFKMYRY